VAVYVDHLRRWPIDQTAPQARSTARRNQGQWCHLWADTVAELHVLAARIGQRMAWFQDRPGFPHYDLTPAQRYKAIAAGAREQDLRAWLRSRKRMQTNKKPPGSDGSRAATRWTVDVS
jgi:hypothetical protein